MRRSILLLGLAVFTFGSSFLRADHLSVRAMCAEADAIMLGRVKDDETAIVEHWLLPPRDMPAAPGEIQGDWLASHSRDTYLHRATLTRTEPVRLTTDRFVAFLKWKNGRLEPLSRFPFGSEGMIWIQDGKCWAYSQKSMQEGLYPFGGISSFNPYVQQRLEGPGDENALLGEITAGIAEARDWHSALAEPDPGLRASRLAAYGLVSTSPCGVQTTFIGQIREKLLPLDADAASAVVASLDNVRPGDNADFLLRSLIALNADFRNATPALIRLLQHPDHADPYLVLVALGKTRDPRIVPFLGQFLLHPNPQIRETAEGALSNISFDTLTPAQRAATSPFAAVVLVQPADTPSVATQSGIRVRRVVSNLKGVLPRTFTIEQATLASNSGSPWKLAFLRQNEQGQFIPAEGEWLKDYHLWTEYVFWNTHWIPLESISEAIRPGQTAPIRPEVAARRARIPGQYP